MPREPDSTLIDRVKVFVISSGTGAFTLGSAVRAYRGIEALVDGETYSYAIESGSLYEAGRGEYVLSTQSLTRVPTISSNGGSVVDFPTNAELAFTALASDLSVVSTWKDAALVTGFETWADLVLFAPQMADGDQTFVQTGDTGTHIDPATSATVPNSGVYAKQTGYSDPVWLYPTLETQAAQRAQAWAESATAPDPSVPTSKSAKTWAAEAAASAGSLSGPTGASLIGFGGRTVAQAIQQNELIFPGAKSRGGPDVNYWFRYLDSTDKVLPGSFNRRGEMLVMGGFVYAQPKTKLRSGPAALTQTISSNNKLLNEIEAVTGRQFMVPSDRAVALWRQLGILSGSSATFRGITGVVDVTSSTQFVRGRVAQGGWYGTIMQPVIASTLSTAVVDDPRPLRALHGYGQSNAGRGGVAPVILAGVQYPYHTAMFSVGASWETGSGAVNAATLTDLIPAYDQAAQPQMIISAGFAYEALARSTGEVSPGYFLRTDWWGGHSLEWFQSGQTTYNNLMASVTQGFGPVVRDKYGRGYDVEVLFNQGENGVSDAAVGTDQRITYAAGLTTCAASVRTGIKAITTKVPPFQFVQVNWKDQNVSSRNLNVDLAQLDVAVANFGSTIVCSGPTYADPFDADPTQGNNPIHYSQLGKMMQGERAALVSRAIHQYGTFVPLCIERVTRAGAVLTVRVRRPTGVAPTIPLSFDTDWIFGANAPANKGIKASLDSSGAALTVSSVTLAPDPLEFLVTLSADPGAPVRLENARTYEPVSGTMAACRSQIYMSSGVPSTFYAMGFAIPPVTRYYLMADLKVSAT